MKLRQTALRLLVALMMLVGSSTSHAQDPEACEAECESQQRKCIAYCSEHANPMECEASCHQAAEECNESCE